MQDIGKLLSLFGTVFLVLTLVFNLMSHIPKIPGDIDIDKFGFRIYIPFVSAIVLTIILTLIFNFFVK